MTVTILILALIAETVFVLFSWAKYLNPKGDVDAIVSEVMRPLLIVVSIFVLAGWVCVLMNLICSL